MGNFIKLLWSSRINYVDKIVGSIQITHILLLLMGWLEGNLIKVIWGLTVYVSILYLIIRVPLYIFVKVLVASKTSNM
ncbi:MULTISPECIES: hypothetical protein [Bacillus cereus group]|uniref:Uncharacterized protein n=1 Tax=Bacillus thuringiensis serovar mexicanensis TaxID=180868 RepID=A0A242WA70_BACTU|nr:MULTISPECIES: hypothetical protein [Bacillus cereus group]MEB9673951.1 hypothetical protein [Bacillus anthracis]OTW50866.1 hypothetical protein BK699_09990 [Bacillus thuringiensis serovar mexicanensis]OTX09551.1 hypothetical protein BK705_05035 [Bacillus thuringiensis serovar monterrey]PFJ22606.1 hypothetical protein COI92_29165 [Bacillus anthracis]PGW01306.1 hypothetical protein COD87_27845 [Bacillus cereus]